MKQRICAIFLAVILLAGLCVVPVSDVRADNVIVVLDPGHGGMFPGCVANGVPYEKEMSLSIALHCKAELETYEGITVIMTRTSDVHLDSNLKAELRRRIEIAAENNAAFLVSLHLNATETHNTSGATVFISFQPNIHAQSAAMGNLILAQLSALGLPNLGCVTSKSDIYFQNGQPLDYYAINRHGASLNVPSIIVENCFMDNPASIDRALCQSEEGRRKLGIANATGIAQYFGLSKKQPAVPEVTVPETTVPETTVPETTVPETTVPETTVPETTVPETTVPETTVPETDSSGTAVFDGNRIVSGNTYAELTGRTLISRDGSVLVTGIAPGTTAQQFISSVQTGQTLNVSLVKADGAVCAADASVGTGTQLVLTVPGSNAELIRCPLVIYGDIDGSSDISIVDFSVAKAHLLGRTQLNTAQAEAADVDRNGIADIMDFSIMKGYLLGRVDIAQ